MNTASATPAVSPLLRWSAVAARLLVAAVFIFAASMKIQDVGRFAKEVRTYQAFPEQWSQAIAIIVPWAEMLTAALLIVGIWRREARLLLGCMLSSFILLKLLAIAQGIDLSSCGCWGHGNVVSETMNKLFAGTWGLLLNGLLLGGLLLDGWVCGRQQAVSAAPPGSLNVAAETQPA